MNVKKFLGLFVFLSLVLSLLAPGICVADDCQCQCLTLDTFTKLSMKSKAAVLNLYVVMESKEAMSFLDPGAGTGFAVKYGKGTYILSNKHVVNESTIRVTAKLYNGKNIELELVGTSKEVDMSILKIKDPSIKIKSLRLADFKTIEEGQWVMAIGNAIGMLGHTINVGIISNTNRIMIDVTSHPFIQTDININHGNSGGPLLNLNGEVIGINTAKIIKAEGLGFAIPVNIVKEELEEIINNKGQKAGWAGLAFAQSFDPGLLAIYGYLDSTLTKGVMITVVEKDSPAEKSGLKQGDIITLVKGQEINDVSSLERKIANTAPGENLIITVLSPPNQIKKITLEIQEKPKPKKEE